MLKAVIIEDEPKSQLVLKEFIKNYCDGVEIIGYSDSIEDSIPLINNLSPNLVFLDIELADGNGLQLLSHFENPGFETILVTGYDQYAIAAIKKNALDYILKPIVVNDLKKAIEKAKVRIKETRLIKDFQKVETVQKSDNGKIILKDLNLQLQIIDPQNILYIEAQNQYTKWVFNDQSSLILRYSMKRSLEVLPDFFSMIHRSYIVNLNKVSKIDKGRGGFLHIANVKLPISYRKKNFLKQHLQNLS